MRVRYLLVVDIKNSLHRSLTVLIAEEKVCKLSAIGRGHAAVGKDSDLVALNRWQAPEVIRKATTSIKSDVWSFGVTFWEILTFAATPYPDSMY